MLSRVSSVCCFIKPASEEKQKRIELESEVTALMAKLAAAEADKTALIKQLEDANTKQDDLFTVIEKVQAENDELRFSPSLRRTAYLKVRKLSPFVPKDKDALTAPAN